MSFNRHSITESLSRSPVVTNQDDSKRYWNRLEEYCSENVLNPRTGFCCGHKKACRSSAERNCSSREEKDNSFSAGQLSYVGDGYAVEIGGKPMRILVVPMQVGKKRDGISMKERREQVLERIPHPGKDRNKHMPGVIQVLQVLMDLDQSGKVKIDDGRHVLEAYAMANSVLCSNLPTGGRSRRGSPTDDMLTNCREHLRQTIVLLEPTIIVSQGDVPAKALWDTVDGNEPIRDRVARVTVEGVQAIYCELRHPSWSGWAKHFREEGRPALLHARELALEPPPTP